MQRIYSILDILKKKKQVSIDELCHTLYCSPATVRRDLKQLADMKAIKRIRGGAMLVGGTNFDYSATYRKNVNVQEKEYICGLAKDFLQHGMSLFLDSSSTVEKICPHLDMLKDITVVTNGIGTALLLNECENVDTYITGGHLKKGSHTMLGESACNFLRGFKADLALISCRGIDDEGIYEADQGQCSIKQYMMENSKNVLMLCDSSKFGTTFFHRLCTFSEKLTVITDKAPSEKLLETASAQGCEVVF